MDVQLHIEGPTEKILKVKLKTPSETHQQQVEFGETNLLRGFNVFISPQVVLRNLVMT
jgi:hypothetical protein